MNDIQNKRTRRTVGILKNTLSECTTYILQLDILSYQFEIRYLGYSFLFG